MLRSGRNFKMLLHGGRSLVSTAAPLGILDRLVGRSGTRQVSMTESFDARFDALESSSPADSFPDLSTRITTLSNGVRVASQDWSGATSLVGIHVGAGIRDLYSPEHVGLPAFLSKVMFRGTRKRTAFKITRDLEEMAAKIAPCAHRESFNISCETLKEDAQRGFEIVSDLIINPDLHPYLIRDCAADASDLLETIPDEARLENMFHAAAFGIQPLGISMTATRESLDVFSGTDAVAEFYSANFVPNRMVVAAVGIPHEEAVSMAEAFLGHVHGSKSSSSSPVSQYMSGEAHDSQKTRDGLAHVYIGFGFQGWTHEDVPAAVVLQTLLGGGKSFSTGGPGKGMYTRLYRDALCEHHWIKHAFAQLTPYRDVSLFGVHGTAAPTQAADLAHIICEQLALVAQPSNLSEEEVSRAKNQTKYQLLEAYENKMAAFEDIGASVLIMNERKEMEYFLDKISSLTSARISAVAKSIVEGSSPTLVTLNAAPGCTPKYSDIEKFFK